MSSFGLQECRVRLLMPFEIDLASFPGTDQVAQTIGHVWERPNCPRTDDYVSRLDDLVYRAFFDQVPNGFLYRRLTSTSDKFRRIQLAKSAEANAQGSACLEFQLHTYGVELFLNPQGVGIVSIALERKAECAPSELRRFLHGLSQTGSLAERAYSETGEIISHALNQLLGDLANSEDFVWRRRIILSGFRATSGTGAAKKEWDDLQAACGLLLPAESQNVGSGNLDRVILNPCHSVAVSENGIAHATEDSIDKPDHDVDRLEWVIGPYSLLAIHEILYRNAVKNLQRTARRTVEGRKSVSVYVRSLIQFQLYADIGSASPIPSIRQYYQLVSRVFGGADALVRLRQATGALEQMEVTERMAETSKESAGLQKNIRVLAEKTAENLGELVKLQRKVELLEVFIFSYYLIALTHYVYHSAHIADGYTMIVYLTMAVVGGGVCLLDPDLREHVFGPDNSYAVGRWLANIDHKRLPRLMLGIPVVIWLALFSIGCIFYSGPGEINL